MKTSAGVLEFESLRELLGRYLHSPMGHRELEKVEPHTDLDRLNRDLAEAGEAIGYLRLAGSPQPAARGAAIRVDFGGLPDVEASIHKLRIEGATLDRSRDLRRLLAPRSRGRRQVGPYCRGRTF